MNLRTARVEGDAVLLGGLAVPLPRETIKVIGDAGLSEVTLGVRPESLGLVPSGSDGGFELVVELVEELGADALVHGSIAGEGGDRLVMRVDGRTPPALGQTVTVTVRDAGELHLFDPRSGARLV